MHWFCDISIHIFAWLYLGKSFRTIVYYSFAQNGLYCIFKCMAYICTVKILVHNLLRTENKARCGLGIAMCLAICVSKLGVYWCFPKLCNQGRTYGRENLALSHGWQLSVFNLNTSPWNVCKLQGIIKKLY
jgi:hypothetical protein